MKQLFILFMLLSGISLQAIRIQVQFTSPDNNKHKIFFEYDTGERLYRIFQFEDKIYAGCYDVKIKLEKVQKKFHKLYTDIRWYNYDGKETVLPTAPLLIKCNEEAELPTQGVDGNLFNVHVLISDDEQGRQNGQQILSCY